MTFASSLSNGGGIEKRIDINYNLPKYTILEHKLREKFGDNLKALGEIADVICGPFGSAIKNTDYQESGIPLIRITNISKKLHIDDVINLYDEIYKHVPKKVFLARWYPAETDAEYRQSVYRIDAIKEVIDELGLQLTDLGTRDTGTFDIREVMYHDIRECDIFVADLTGARHNVMIEVGYALKHIDTGRMVFYFQETDSCKNVPFDVNHFSYDKIEDSVEIKTKTKARIMKILEQAKNGEI